MDLITGAKVRRFLPHTKKLCTFFIDLLRQSRGNVTEFRKKFSGCRKIQKFLLYLQHEVQIDYHIINGFVRGKCG